MEQVGCMNGRWNICSVKASHRRPVPVSLHTKSCTFPQSRPVSVCLHTKSCTFPQSRPVSVCLHIVLHLSPVKARVSMSSHQVLHLSPVKARVSMSSHRLAPFPSQGPCQYVFTSSCTFPQSRPVSVCLHIVLHLSPVKARVSMSSHRLAPFPSQGPCQYVFTPSLAPFPNLAIHGASKLIKALHSSLLCFKSGCRTHTCYWDDTLFVSFSGGGRSFGSDASFICFTERLVHTFCVRNAFSLFIINCVKTLVSFYPFLLTEREQ